MERVEYPACSHLEGFKAAVTVDEDFINTITLEARVLPLYEERIHKYKYTKGYSLYTNEMLQCRWTEFKNTRKSRIPFHCPSAKDMHFINHTVKIQPKGPEQVNHRKYLSGATGIDKFGQAPVPDNKQFRKAFHPAPRDKKINKNVMGKAQKELSS